MALSPAESCVQKIACALPRDCDACRSATKAKDVHVVILNALARRKFVVADSGAHAVHLVRGHRGAHAASADQNAPFHVSARHRMGERNRKVRIIVNRVEVGVSEIDDLVSLGGAIDGLLAQQVEGLLAASGRARLDTLMNEYRRGLVQKAKALKTAVDRGLQPPLNAA